MITWMQKHKKYLVVTIWISTIAFVGAGFVGWGSYDFNKSNSTVATVNDKDIPLNLLQQEYSNLYQKYNKMFGGTLNQEKAKQFGLEDMALRNLIQQYTILSYADEIELKALDIEVAKKISTEKMFLKDNKFNKEQYLKVLQQANIKPSEYEESLKKEIIIEKIINIFSLKANETEHKLLSSLILSEDKLSVKIIDSEDFNIMVDAKEIKEYWEQNKNNYLSDKKFELETIFIKRDSKTLSEDKLKDYYKNNRTLFKDKDGKILSFENAKDKIIKKLQLKNSKKIALKRYIKFKKGEIVGERTIQVDSKKMDYGKYNSKIIEAKKDKVLKPFEYDDGYIIIKLKNIIEPTPLPFNDASDMATNDLIKNLTSKKLEKLSKEALKDFKGKDIGFINRYENNIIDGLTESEINNFKQQLFSNDKKSDFIIVGTKSIIYKIEEQRLATDSKIEKFIQIDAIYKEIDNIKKTLILNNFVKQLSNRYRIESYMQKDSNDK